MRALSRASGATPRSVVRVIRIACDRPHMSSTFVHFARNLLDMQSHVYQRFEDAKLDKRELNHSGGIKGLCDLISLRTKDH